MEKTISLAEMVFFELQKVFFFIHTAGVAGEFSTCAQNSMAGDKDGDGVSSHSAAYGLGRSAGELLCQITVSNGFAIRYV